jgi:hypothetical protein
MLLVVCGSRLMLLVVCGSRLLLLVVCGSDVPVGVRWREVVEVYSRSAWRCLLLPGSMVLERNWPHWLVQQ